VDDHDPLADAFSRAGAAMRSRSRSSIRVALASGFAAVLTVTPSALALLSQDFITRTTTAGLIGAAAALTVPIFLALEAQRLCDRSDALRDLYAAQRQYEVLLRAAWAERDQLKQANALLDQQNATLRTLFGLTVVARAEEREEP